MPVDETVLDPPVTPAPVFAYRALRGVFFGSPDSSPEHVHNNDNKENLTPVLSPSPSKRKLVLDGAGSDALHLTPSTKRAKRDGGGAILSPTKGILRTPGLATPRAKALRDVNVKFKSVSPEEVSQRRNNNRLKTEAPRQVGAEKEDKQAASVKDKKTTIPKYEGVSTGTKSAAGNDQATAVSAFTPCAIEAYIAQTEKEMKKLVKYGQKMREYARKKDAENLELKGMIEVLKGENERLRTAQVGTSQTQTESKQIHGFESDTNGHGGQNVEEVTDKGDYGYVREEVGRVEARSQSWRSPSQSLAHRRKDETSRTIAATSTKSQTTAPELSRTKRHQGLDPPTLSNRSRKPSVLLPDPIKMEMVSEDRALPLRSTFGSVAIRDTSGTFDREIGATGSTRLAPDRLAAARERLRRRAEARKASAVEMHATSTSAHGHQRKHSISHGQREGTLIDIDETDDDDDDKGPEGLKRLTGSGPRRESREQSLVDWVNL
ncbi:uncharacterized protein PV06_09346 [Exophiala oligosperma]|uniref:Spindle pole body-associated protein cut12 domain-containing protein n=1 Tax=Exophiala oligosperma TaxID=215243 RepID=A0A0D2D7J2_9EURO|nr:uncharacterized protein PV06_09346 [Exophiala oligosperma]KIW38375.1 hypothetical protein PV06_09346 [Exophiala oligosperma]